jgi:Flp pilus assembly protein TadD
MRIWKIAAIAALGLSSFGADNVAPTKAELEDMYNTAYRAFDAGKFPEALKQLDAIDARQPDLAASKNLRGVILMRQGNYDQAEAGLTEAARIDPKFWNARFNLAEIPFLKKDWDEARKRFEQLLSTGQSDLAKEASQLIQYKILLTYLMQGKSNMVDSILAKLELSPDTPAVDYVKAAVALQQKNEAEAKDWISAAEKNYPPQLNKLFAESLYEVGWLEKPAGQRRASLPLMTAAERTEKTKAVARSKFEQSQQAFRQRDFTTALKLVDEADKADPNQPATLNLRGEILMQQGQFDNAETAFKKAAKLDPKLRDAQYNLAQIPFKKKEYAKARDRFETLYKRIPGGEKNQASELIKFKIYMTLLMEGKESRAHSMMEEFQFTGDTPALYYAQAAWEYKHNNSQKAEDWTNSANKIYSPALNGVFADAFYDVGWLQRPEGSTAPAVAFDSSNVTAPQAEGGPAVEPSPIPDKIAAGNNQSGTLSLAPATSGLDGGMDLASAGVTANQTRLAAPAVETSSPPEQTASQSASTSGEATSASPAVGAETTSVSSSSNQGPNEESATAAASPAKEASLGTAAVASSSSNVAGVSSRRLWIVGGLLLAAVVALALAILPALRRYKFRVPGPSRPEASANNAEFKPRTAPAQPGGIQGNGFASGPHQVSLQLKPWKPALRHTALPSAKPGTALDRLKVSKPTPSRTPVLSEPQRKHSEPLAEPVSEAVGLVFEQSSEIMPAVVSREAEPDDVSGVGEFVEASAAAPQRVDNEILELPEEPALAAYEPPEFSEQATEEVGVAVEQSNDDLMNSEYAWPAEAGAPQLEPEPIGNHQPPEVIVPEHENLAGDEGFAKREAVVGGEVPAQPEAPIVEANFQSVSEFESGIPAQPIFPQTTTPATMPESTQTPPAPIAKAPAPPMAKPQPQPPAPVPASGMQTSVQLTFSFEIAAMQLTPSFKMGVLKVRPLSKLVTMRLPSPQRAQSALNLQVAFEVVKIQPVAGALGTVRVMPSQQQRPTMGGMPSFAVAGLQVVPNSETAPVQLTPSPQGRAAVFITVPFQISTLEFSPSLEIGSVTLNSNSKQVIVQLPGTGPGPAEGAPMFEIANLELNEAGEIAMMQLNLLGGPKRA